jgi:hypothetical protein
MKAGVRFNRIYTRTVELLSYLEDLLKQVYFSDGELYQTRTGRNYSTESLIELIER